jgi:hypothetical protein
MMKFFRQLRRDSGPVLLGVALVCISVLAPATTFGASGPKNLHIRPSTNPAINAATAAASRSFEVENKSGGLGLLIVYITYVEDNTSTSAVTMTCTASDDNNTTDYKMQSCTVSSGACTSSDASWTLDPDNTGTTYWVWRVDVEGYEDFECTFAFTGGEAADLLTAKYQLSTKG